MIHHFMTDDMIRVKISSSVFFFRCCLTFLSAKSANFKPIRMSGSICSSDYWNLNWTVLTYSNICDRLETVICIVVTAYNRLLPIRISRFYVEVQNMKIWIWQFLIPMTEKPTSRFFWSSEYGNFNSTEKLIKVWFVWIGILFPARTYWQMTSKKLELDSNIWVSEWTKVGQNWLNLKSLVFLVLKIYW